MKRILYVISFVFITATSSSQSGEGNKAFDSIYYEVAVNISSNNPRRALQIADSLYLYSDLKLNKLRGLMLKADIVEKQGKHKEAIENTLKAMELAEEIKNYVWQAKIYGFLSSQYRNIGLLDQGKIYLKKGIDISTKIENKILASQYRGMTYQEMAYYSFEELNYKEALEYVEMAALSFNMIQDEQQKNFFIGNNEEMYGRSYSGLKEYEKAKEHYYKSLHYLKKIEAENSQWGGMNYEGLGNIYLKQKKIDSAGIYLYKALSIIENTDHAALKENLYQNFSTYYKTKKQMDSFAFYENKYNAILQENIANAKESINNEFNRATKKETRYNTTFIYTLLGLFLLVVLTIFLYTKRKIWFKSNDWPSKEEIGRIPPLVLLPKTEQELLEKLNEFEASHDYLDKNMSFSVLVGQLGTNAKYLSHLIKNNKQKDYNTYINELRIQYIVDKLKNDPEYLNYKISYLAEESGFSSHSKFSANFKRMVNLSPSEYIDSLRD